VEIATGGVMAEIVAFEGKRSGRVFFAWGTAAVRDGDRLLNSTRQISSSFEEEEFKTLVNEGALTALTTPIEISTENAKLPLVVLEINAAEGFEHELHVDQNRIATVLASATSGGHHYYVFASHEVFRGVASTLIAQALRCLLYLDKWTEGHDRLLRSAMALDAHHPVINALRAFRSTNAEAFLPIARNNLRSDEARQVFESAWLAFTHTDLSYVLKYKGGLVREEGGMQIGHVARLMKSIQAAHPVLATTIVRKHPFLLRPPETQLYELKAASAEFHFTVPQVSLGERFARYLELELFEQALDGSVPDTERVPPAFVEAVRQIAAPDEKTAVSQKLGANALRPVRSKLEGDEEPFERWSPPLNVLGYQSGLVRDTEQIEINMFPGHRILVSSTDNGAGARPIGLDFLQTRRDFLYQPALYKIQRRLHDSTERYFLQEVFVLKQGAKGVVTAIHSSIVAGAFVCNLSIRVARNGGRLVFGEDSLSGVEARAIGDAQKWMLAFGEICRKIELSDKRHTRLAPHRMPPTPFLLQVLWAVAELGGGARQADVVLKINEHFSKSALVNNTRREVLKNESLLQFADEPKVITITPEGRRYLAAFDRVARRVQ
jgi:hypothetical protein